MNQNLREDAMMEEAIASAEISMETPDTEWREVEKLIKHDVDCSAYCDSNCNQSHTHFDENDCDCVVGKVIHLLTSRDTYWKERVRKEVEDRIKKDLYEHIEEYVARRRRLNIPVTVNRLLEHMQTMFVQPTPITNEDNLK